MKTAKVHIVVFRLSSMGDVAMTVPVLRCLLTQYPHLRLTVVSRPFFEPFFENLPNTSFFKADVDVEFKGFFGLWRLAQELSKLKPDLLADLHGVLRSQILKRILYFRYAIPYQTIKKDRVAKKKLCAQKPNKQLIRLKSTHERYADVFERLGYPIDLSKYEPYPKMSESLRVDLLLPTSKKILIGIAPFARYEGKTYSKANMLELLKLIKASFPEAILYFFAAKNDATALEEYAKISSTWVTLANKLSLKEELILIQKLDLMLTMDSANMHIASMLDVPVISLWGATHPCLGFYGWRQDYKNGILADYQLYPTLPCSVNGKKMHREAIGCMSSILPETVLTAIQRELQD